MTKTYHAGIHTSTIISCPHGPTHTDWYIFWSNCTRATILTGVVWTCTDWNCTTNKIKINKSRNNWPKKIDLRNVRKITSLFVGLFIWWCLTALSTIFQLYRVVSFIGGGNRSSKRKPPTCCKSLTNIMLYTSPWLRFKLTTSVVIGTDCIGSCKSNYHTITTTTLQLEQ